MIRDNLITIIRAKIDEINPDPGTTEMGEVFSVIETLLEESANTLLMKVPLHLAPIHFMKTGPGGNQDPDPLGAIERDWGQIALPVDYLRLNAFKMREWSVTVTDAISEQHPKYRNQFNKYLKGKPQNPVVAIAYDSSTSDKVLRYFSMPGLDHVIEVATYVKRIYREDEIPKPNLNYLVDISTLPDALQEVLTWQAAGDTLIAVQQPEKASVAYTKVQEWLTSNTR